MSLDLDVPSLFKYTTKRLRVYRFQMSLRLIYLFTISNNVYDHNDIFATGPWFVKQLIQCTLALQHIMPQNQMSHPGVHLSS